MGLASALFSSFAALTQKKVLIKNSPLTFTTVLAIFNLLLLLPLAFLNHFSDVSLVTSLVIIFKTILSGTAFLMVMNGIKRAEISKSLPLLVLTPGVVAVFAFLFLGEKLSIENIMGVLLLTIGTFLLQYSPKTPLIKLNVKERRGIYYILIALAIFSTTAILDKLILKRYKVPALDFWFYQHLILFLFFATISFFNNIKIQAIKSTVIKSWKLIFLIAIFTLIYRFTFIEAVKIAPVALVLSVKRLSVLFVTIFGGLYFKEKSLKKRITATVLMLIGTALVILY